MAAVGRHPLLSPVLSYFAGVRFRKAESNGNFA